MSTSIPSFPELERPAPLIEDDEFEAHHNDHIDASVDSTPEEQQSAPAYETSELAPTSRPPLPPRHEEHEPNATEDEFHAQIANLKQMFPDFDDAVLQSVLESVQWDQDRAIDTLLGMNDPDYIPQHVQQPQQSQTELDEELARRLQLEDDQQIAAGYQNPQQYQQQQQQHYDVPYEARRSYANRQPQPVGDQQYEYSVTGGQNAGGGRDTMSEVQEQFKQIAESGKKTFSSLMTKVKAKIQDFDQSRSTNTGSSTDQNRWGGGSSYGGGQYQQNQQQNAYSQQASYYEPDSPPISLHDARTPPLASSNTSATPVQGYDISSRGGDIGRPDQRSNTGEPQLSTSPYSSSFSPSLRPPTTNSGPPPNLDPAKIGLLPKRPVSLLGGNTNNSNSGQSVQLPHSQSPPTRRATVDDDDDLDYVENPFEER